MFLEMRKPLATSFVVLILLCNCGCKKETAVAQEPPYPVYEEVDDRPLPMNDIAIFKEKFKPRLLRGFYPGSEEWKWTGQSFALLIDPPEPAQPTMLHLDFSVPKELIQEVGKVTLTAKVNGVEVCKQEYSKDERLFLDCDVAASLLQHKPTEVEFSMDKIAKGAGDHPYGLIVVGAGLMPKQERPLDRATAIRMSRASSAEVTAESRKMVSTAQRGEYLKLFHKLPVWNNSWFQNVQILKNPLDLWMMQQVMYELQPEVVIETGTFLGGSALYWAQVLDNLGLSRSRVFTVDLTDFAKTAETFTLWKKYVTLHVGSSTDRKIVDDIGRAAKGRRTIVTLDSDHHMEHVLNELHAYAPMVSCGSYIVVEDTHMDGVPTYPEHGPGPMAAVKKFLSEPIGKEFAPDFDREAYIMTFNPGGWLKRTCAK